MGAVIGFLIARTIARNTGGNGTGTGGTKPDPTQVEISGYRYNQNCCGDRRPLFQPYSFSSDTRRMGLMSV